MRAALKEPAKTQAMTNETFAYNAGKWEAGKLTQKNAVDALSKAGI
eukprot:CAMPEP_0204642112 /NCGR_PEP_ID=MMETSP0717-20131115/51511_1 /ASSEMBLY_ACC=CAM_ASM_000666 /TAXON_ID=230516 /ORGANISM="Chaetoceros curvisetus" /LENGTH=45 /DNA_ID= /DNA_START= /DNA_END= /DNA_ORIENTATION=